MSTLMRRLKFLVKTGSLRISNRHFYNEVFIIFLAFLAFMVVSQFSPTILHRIKHKGAKDKPAPNTDPSRVRTRSRSEVDTGKRVPYTGHAPYVSDDLMDLVFNAAPCPGSPPVPFASDPVFFGDQVLANETMTYANLIHREQNDKNASGNDKERQSEYDALFVVCSNVNKSENRKFFREIYANASNTWPYRIKVVFLVGRPKSPEVFNNVTKEVLLYSDIVMGNYLDHYDNLTYKTITGYRWIHAHCRNVDMMLKLDDDVFVDVFKFFDVFRPLIKKQKKRTINCFLNKCPRVHRVGKYQISEKEFVGKTYPPFCSGFFIVPTMDFVDYYVSLYKDIRFFRLEDVYSYGMVRTAMVDVQMIHTDLVTVETHEYTNCVLRYRYRCKYVAAQVDYRELGLLRKRMAMFREEMSLTGNQTTYDDYD